MPPSEPSNVIDTARQIRFDAGRRRSPAHTCAISSCAIVVADTFTNGPQRAPPIRPGRIVDRRHRMQHRRRPPLVGALDRLDLAVEEQLRARRC